MKYYGFQPRHLDLDGRPYTFGIEKITEVRDEIIPLNDLHWQEVEGNFLTRMTKDVSYDRYGEYEKKGQFVLFTARDPSLCGYLMCFVHRNFHSNKDLVGREDAMFVHADHRGSGVGSALLDFVEDTLQKMGCSCLILSSRHHAGGADLTSFLTRRGFKPSAVVFMKEFDDVQTR
jgi:GNAT superfamily N-acetyltransferase